MKWRNEIAHFAVKVSFCGSFFFLFFSKCIATRVHFVSSLLICLIRNLIRFSAARSVRFQLVLAHDCASTSSSFHIQSARNLKISQFSISPVAHFMFVSYFRINQIWIRFSVRLQYRALTIERARASARPDVKREYHFTSFSIDFCRCWCFSEFKMEICRSEFWNANATKKYREYVLIFIVIYSNTFLSLGFSFSCEIMFVFPLFALTHLILCCLHSFSRARSFDR